jgi:hypothetical protein
VSGAMIEADVAEMQPSQMSVLKIERHEARFEYKFPVGQI